MQRESGFQKAVIEAFRSYGFFVGVGSLTPGFPDLTAIKNGRVLLSELKDITGKSVNVQAISLFQKAQLPFYCRFVSGKNEAINIMIKNDNLFYLYVIRRVEDVKMILNSSVDSILQEGMTFRSVKELINFVSL